jgi:Kef-type K+ transport system membrane component KefB
LIIRVDADVCGRLSSTVPSSRTPVSIYRRELTPAERVPFALYLSTALPLVVAIVSIGLQSGMMRNEVPSALAGAAMISALVFPMAADLLSKGGSDVAIVAESGVIE